VTIRHGVLLAAGRGTRMGELTAKLPKAMLEVAGSTMLSRVIDRLRSIADEVHVTVGHQGSALAAHAIECGAASVTATTGHGNAWWLYNSLLGRIDEPVLVSTCDVLAELDFDGLIADHRRLGEPPCLLVAVEPVAGVEGDFIFAEGDWVVRLTRAEPAPTYCSGLQIVNPARIRALTEPADDFAGVWSQLAARRALAVSRVRPASWTALDTRAHIAAISRAGAQAPAQLAAGRLQAAGAERPGDTS